MGNADDLSSELKNIVSTDSVASARCAFCGLKHTSTKCEHARVFNDDATDADISAHLRAMVYLRGAAAYAGEIESRFPDISIKISIRSREVAVRIMRPFYPCQPLEQSFCVPWSAMLAETTNPIVKRLDTLMPNVSKDL